MAIGVALPHKEFACALELPNLTCFSAKEIRHVYPGDEGVLSVAVLFQQCRKRLVDVALHYQSLTASALLDVLQNIPNVEKLQLTTHDGAVRIPPLAGGFDSRDKEMAILEPILHRFAPDAVDSQASFPFPNLRELVVVLRDLTDGVRRDLTSLLRARRSVGRAGVQWLEQLTVGVDEEASLDAFRGELERCGVEVRGVTLKSRCRTT
jgi:hypothetical protein